ncbi:PhzF family phenazine biosynthesis protein [Paenibacillus gyeongsangnamensis]
MTELMMVDAFTDRPFHGNPAAVCFLDAFPGDAWMQQAAMEMQQSETAFLCQEGPDYRLRWFTPDVEVDLCGHATLAAAHALWETDRVPLQSEIRFHTRSGLLTARRQEDWIRLDFPSEPVVPMECPPGLAEALGTAEIGFTGTNRMDLLVEVADEETVRRLKPDYALLSAIPVRGVLVTARSDSSGTDFVSRCFFPRLGIPEDPVTGSAHCALAPYWASKLGKRIFTAKQCSAREGTLRIELTETRMLLYGQAVTVLKGNLLPPPRR